MFGLETRHPNTFLDVFLSDVAFYHQASFFLKQTHAFNLRLINRACSSCLSRGAHGAVCPSQTTIELCLSHHSEVYPKHLKTEVCTSVHSCTYLIIPINVPRVCSTGSQDFWKRELVHRWQVPLWYLPQWNDEWWLTAISGLGNITDNPDQFFPPAGAEWGTFSQDRRRALIGSRPVIVIMCASHCSLLWLGEPRLNLYLIRPLHRGWHSSWWEGLRSTLPLLDSMDGLAPDTGSRLVSDWGTPSCHHHPLHKLVSFINLIKCCQNLVVKTKETHIMLYTRLWNCKAEMTESILEALHCAVVNKSMGEEERHINLSLTWPGLQHPNANGSYGHRCGHSHKLTQVLFQLSHICKSLP